MVCYFRICILISGPFSSVALGDIFTYSSEQSELAVSDTCLRCEHVSLLCCIAYALMMSRRDGRGVPTATSFQSHEVMSKKACCQEGAGCAALPASSEMFQLRL